MAVVLVLENGRLRELTHPSNFEPYYWVLSFSKLILEIIFSFCQSLMSFKKSLSRHLIIASSTTTLMNPTASRLLLESERLLAASYSIVMRSYYLRRAYLKGNLLVVGIKLS
jgi:hypothetical protein